MVIEIHIRTQKQLLNSLILGCNNLILEVTKLNVANLNLKSALTEMKAVLRHHLFWKLDTNAISLNYLSEIVCDTKNLISIEVIQQLP